MPDGFELRCMRYLLFTKDSIQNEADFERANLQYFRIHRLIQTKKGV